MKQRKTQTTNYVKHQTNKNHKQITQNNIKPVKTSSNKIKLNNKYKLKSLTNK